MSCFVSLNFWNQRVDMETCESGGAPGTRLLEEIPGGVVDRVFHLKNWKGWTSLLSGFNIWLVELNIFLPITGMKKPLTTIFLNVFFSTTNHIIYTPFLDLSSTSRDDLMKNKPNILQLWIMNRRHFSEFYSYTWCILFGVIIHWSYPSRCFQKCRTEDPRVMPTWTSIPRSGWWKLLRSSRVPSTGDARVNFGNLNILTLVI